MCVDLPDQHTIHTIEPLAFKCYQHFYLLEVSFSLTLIYHFLNYRTYVRFLVVPSITSNVKWI